MNVLTSLRPVLVERFHVPVSKTQWDENNVDGFYPHETHFLIKQEGFLPLLESMKHISSQETFISLFIYCMLCSLFNIMKPPFETNLMVILQGLIIMIEVKPT